MRLYYDDSFLTEFSATVVGCDERGVWLDQSAFYPESGGQMGDHGRLRCGDEEIAVVDVQEEAGRVLHMTAAPVGWAAGAAVTGQIDQARRREHMALHTGQHILSRALSDECRAETVSARLGDHACTIDVDREQIPEGELARAEALANAVVEDDVPVAAFFPTPAELSALALRKEPKQEHERVRVVRIGGGTGAGAPFDVTPCGGTHCSGSAQVSLVSIVGLERRKRRLRITFTAGARGRRQLSHEAELMRRLSRELSCGPGDVGEALAKRDGELKELRRQSADWRARFARAQAETLAASAGARVVSVCESAEFARELAKQLTELGKTALLASVEGDALHVVLARGSDDDIDCGQLAKRLGRGGGRPERAESRIADTAPSAWPSIVTDVLGDD